MASWATTAKSTRIPRRASAHARPHQRIPLTCPSAFPKVVASDAQGLVSVQKLGIAGYTQHEVVSHGRRAHQAANQSLNQYSPGCSQIIVAGVRIMHKTLPKARNKLRAQIKHEVLSTMICEQARTLFCDLCEQAHNLFRSSRARSQLVSCFASATAVCSVCSWRPSST